MEQGQKEDGEEGWRERAGGERNGGKNMRKGRQREKDRNAQTHMEK